MRRVLGRGGLVSVLAGALALAACADDSAVTPVGFTGVGGAPINVAGSATAGALPLGGFGGSGAVPGACSGLTPMHFGVTRYSVADIDASLDLAFGEGERLADALGPYDRGHQRPISLRFVEALLSVARARASTAAQEASDLEVCAPDAEDGASCLQPWLRSFGEQLYRRPLADEQVGAYLVAFRSAESRAERELAATDALTSMVLSPYFLLRLEVTDPSTGRISPHDIASRLSHLAARRIPDAALRASASAGELAEPAARLAHLRRLASTPAGRAARELQLLEWVGIEAAPSRADLAEELVADMTAQARALISAVYAEDDGAILAFFQRSRLPLNDRLAEHYGLPSPGSAELVPVELDAQLFAGLLSTGALLSRYPRPSERGAALMAALLCQEVPLAPPDHDYTLPPRDTPRQSLEAALDSRPGCIGCHDTFDPVGFALEAFDDRGRLSGWPTYGSVTPNPVRPAIPVAGPAALGKAAVTSDAGVSCFARRSLEYVLGRSLPEASLIVRSIAPPGEIQQPVVIRPDPDEEWSHCLMSALSGEPSLTVLTETIALSDLMTKRTDAPRRVVALDTSTDPLEHAYQETQQLVGAYPDPLDDAQLRLYAQTLSQARGATEPAGGAGAGGESGGAGAGGAP